MESGPTHRGLVLRGAPSALCALRGALRHTFLENLIESRTSAEVVRLRHSVPQIRGQFDADISTGGPFDQKIAQIRAFSAAVVSGLSPRALVQAGPLQDLPRCGMELLSEVLHAEYLRISRIESVVTEISEATDEFALELGRFRGVWQHSPARSDAEAVAAFDRLRSAARFLRQALGNIPEGFVVP